MTFEEWWEQVEAYGLGLPEGYVLVPKEPTEKMADVIHDKVMAGDMITTIYPAILQAAQEEE